MKTFAFLFLYLQLNCYKNELRTPLDCECDVRKYLRDIIQEKSELAGEIAKHHNPEKKKPKK